MHKLKIKNYLFNLKNLAIAAALLCYVLLLPASALAASDAEKACAIGHYDKKNSAIKAACVDGYDGGHAKKDRDAVCKKYSGDNLDACYFGFGKGACSIDNPNQAELNNCLNGNPIVNDLRIVINFLSAGVGVIVTGSIIYAGIQYTIAGNDSNAVGAAKKRIQDSIIALVTFFFIWAFLQWLIPGGLLNGIL